MLTHSYRNYFRQLTGNHVEQLSKFIRQNILIRIQTELRC